MQAGVHTGNWLTRGQAEQLLDEPDSTALKGKQDRALLAVLRGFGLRKARALSEPSEVKYAPGTAEMTKPDDSWAVRAPGQVSRAKSLPVPPG